MDGSPYWFLLLFLTASPDMDANRIPISNSAVITTLETYSSEEECKAASRMYGNNPSMSPFHNWHSRALLGTVCAKGLTFKYK